MSSIQKIFNQPWSILYLLPYTNNFILTCRQRKKDELLLIQNLINTSIAALDSFLNGNLHHFDALVGENLCQIRAYKTIHLAIHWLENGENKNTLLNTLDMLKRQKSNIESVINEWVKQINEINQYNNNLDDHETVEAFLKRHNLYIELFEDIIYLISCYFLTHYAVKNDNIPTAVNFSKISFDFKVSKHRSERLVHRYQLIAAKLGCDFIINIASDLPASKSYFKLLPKLLQLSDIDRYVLPCHIVSEIILEHCFNHNIPILLLMNRENLTPQETIYVLITKDHCNELLQLKTEYCFVISGENHSTQPTSIDYLTYLDKLNFMKLVLANTATHPQYSGTKLRPYKEDPFRAFCDHSDIATMVFQNRLLHLKEVAKQLGCCKEYPYEFFLKHIYASKINIEINKLKFRKEVIVSGNSLLTNGVKKHIWIKETTSI